MRGQALVEWPPAIRERHQKYMVWHLLRSQPHTRSTSRSKAANDEKDDPKRGVTAVTAPPKEANLKHSPREAPTRTGADAIGNAIGEGEKQGNVRLAEGVCRCVRAIGEGENKETRPRRKRESKEREGAKGYKRERERGRKMGWKEWQSKLTRAHSLQPIPTPS